MKEQDELFLEKLREGAKKRFINRMTTYELVDGKYCKIPPDLTSDRKKRRVTAENESAVWSELNRRDLVVGLYLNIEREQIEMLRPASTQIIVDEALTDKEWTRILNSLRQKKHKRNNWKKSIELNPMTFRQLERFKEGLPGSLSWDETMKVLLDRSKK